MAIRRNAGLRAAIIDEVGTRLKDNKFPPHIKQSKIIDKNALSRYLEPGYTKLYYIRDNFKKYKEEIFKKNNVAKEIWDLFTIDINDNVVEKEGIRNVDELTGRAIPHFQRPNNIELILEVAILRNKVTLKKIMPIAQRDSTEFPAIYIGASKYFASPELIEKHKEELLVDPNFSCYYFKEDTDANAYLKSIEGNRDIYTKFNNKKGGGYSIENFDLYKYGVDSPTFLISDGLRYTFGVEIEASKGSLPNHLISSTNLACVRDGSLNGGAGGPEYVTGVLKGDAGFNHLKNIVNELNRYCTIDKYCGIHVHVGGMDTTKGFAVAMHHLGLAVQQELFSIFPVSRRKNDYCRLMKDVGVRMPLITTNFKTDLNTSYDTLVTHIAHRKDIDLRRLNKANGHPMGHKCGYHHETPRYEWLNFVPLLFNEKENNIYTIEFRPHSASLNYEKIRNWVLICFALVKFAETQKEVIAEAFRGTKVAPISLREIIGSVYSQKKSDLLIEYIENRKLLFDSKETETAQVNERNEYTERKINSQPLKEICV